MCTYTIQKTNKKKVLLNDTVWDGCPTAEITCVNWQEWEYAPKTECKMLATDEGIYVRFQTADKPYAVCTKFNEPTCRDSCMELFINFAPEQREEYLNFEVNSNGAMLLEFGKVKERSLVTDVDPEIFQIEVLTHDDGWAVIFFVPFSFIQRFYGKTFTNAFRGNLYKCGNRTPKPHYVSWAPICISKPDFHRPDFFGEFKMI